MTAHATTGRPLERAIEASHAAFAAAFRDGDARAAAALYAPGASLLPPSAPLLQGREAIEAFWRAGIESGLDGVELEALELERRDGLAYEIGRYALRLTADRGEVIDRGAYVLVLEQQQDGSWLRTVETFNPGAET